MYLKRLFSTVSLIYQKDSKNLREYTNHLITTVGYTQTGHAVRCVCLTALAAGQQININAVEAGVTYGKEEELFLTK